MVSVKSKKTAATGSNGRTSANRPSNKDKILKAASALLKEQGVAALSVRAIAAAAGLSTIGIYSHFQGKQGILDALYIHGFERVRDAMVSANAIADPHAAVMDGVRRYLQVSLAHEGEYRLIFGERDSSYEPSDEARAAALEAFQSLVDEVSRLLPATASNTDKRRAAIQIWARLHGYVSLRHHTIDNLISGREWRSMVMADMKASIDAIAAHPQ